MIIIYLILGTIGVVGAYLLSGNVKSGLKVLLNLFRRLYMFSMLIGVFVSGLRLILPRFATEKQKPVVRYVFYLILCLGGLVFYSIGLDPEKEESIEGQVSTIAGAGWEIIKDINKKGSIKQLQGTIGLSNKEYKFLGGQVAVVKGILIDDLDIFLKDWVKDLKIGEPLKHKQQDLENQLIEKYINTFNEISMLQAWDVVFDNVKAKFTKEEQEEIARLGKYPFLQKYYSSSSITIAKTIRLKMIKDNLKGEIQRGSFMQTAGQLRNDLRALFGVEPF